MKKHKIKADMLNDLASKQWENYMETDYLFDEYRTWYHDKFNHDLHNIVQQNINVEEIQ